MDDINIYHEKDLAKRQVFRDAQNTLRATPEQVMTVVESLLAASPGVQATLTQEAQTILEARTAARVLLATAPLRTVAKVL